MKQLLLVLALVVAIYLLNYLTDSHTYVYNANDYATTIDLNTFKPSYEDAVAVGNSLRTN